jgi:hypothetical protein
MLLYFWETPEKFWSWKSQENRKPPGSKLLYTFRVSLDHEHTETLIYTHITGTHLEDAEWLGKTSCYTDK